MIENRRGIVGSTISMKEAPLRLQNLFRARPAERSQIDGDHSAFSCMTGLKRFHHGAEIFAQSSSLAGGDRECARGVNSVQTLEPRACGGPPKDTTGAGGMKSVFIVAGRDRFRYLAFHFHTKLVSQEEIFATPAAHFSRSQRCRQHAHRGMHQQSIDAVFAHSELCVVEVVDVNRNSVGESSKAGR